MKVGLPSPKYLKDVIIANKSSSSLRVSVDYHNGHHDEIEIHAGTTKNFGRTLPKDSYTIVDAIVKLGVRVANDPNMQILNIKK